MMKYRIYILFITLLSVWACASDLKDLQEQDGKCLMLTFYNMEMLSKADETTVSEPMSDIGTEAERLINRLDIFLYPKDATDSPCVFYKHMSGISDIGTSVVPVFVTKDIVDRLFPGTAAECEVYVVANLPSSVAFSGSETVNEIKQKSILSEEFSQVAAYDGRYLSPANFLMSGHGTAAKSGESSIGGAIPLIRAASKVTIHLNVPEFLNVEAITDNPGEEEDIVKHEVWYPALNQEGKPDLGLQAMHIGFHKGLQRTYLDEVNDITKADKAKDIFATQYTERFLYKGTGNIESPETGGAPAEGEPKVYYKYSCDVTYYTYAFEWEADNDVDAPYFTLMVPWKRKEDLRYQTYYYQFTPNPQGNDIKRNAWYDITITVGVLGSRTYNEPVILKDDAFTFYVHDWSTDVQTDEVDLQEWQYLVIPEHKIVMNNTTVGYLPYDASHKVAWSVEWPGSLAADMDPLEKYNETSKFGAYYINCGGSQPTAVRLTSVTNSSFAVSSKTGTIDFTNEFPENVYSPIFVHLKVWLDINSNGILDGDEKSFVEHVTFEQYPPIYIIPSKSATRSVFVNGVNYTTSNISYNGGKYVLGQCRGESTDGDHMYVINVSSFNADDTFRHSDDNDYTYMIGDPRVTVNDTNLNNDGFSMSGTWAKDQEGNGRILQFYYPTANNRDGNDPDIFRVISPKFRIASFLGGYSSGSTPEGAAMRCASYQEAGYPAGRWRLPTTAEINFVISLQQKGAIQDIFYGGNYYYSSTDQVRNQATIERRPISWEQSGFTGSVRCVYDEWYWGSEPEATKNSKYGGGYEFTWGDKQR